MTNAKPEQVLQIAAATLLRRVMIPPAWFSAIDHGGRTGGEQAKRIGGIRKAAGLLPGMADLMLCWADGGMGWIELKSKRGVQSPAQVSFEQMVRDVGHHYAVARSIDDVIALLHAWGVPTRLAKPMQPFGERVEIPFLGKVR